jgi:hypothetical protein
MGEGEFQSTASYGVGSTNQARALLAEIDQHPDRMQHQISYTTGADIVVRVCSKHRGSEHYRVAGD